MGDVNLNGELCEVCGGEQLHVVGSPYCLRRMGFEDPDVAYGSPAPLLRALSAAREEARREREQADVWQSQLHDTAAALHLAKEEARRLTGELERWRHGVTVEGDFVCPDSLRATEAESSARRLREALRVYFPAGSWCAKCGQSIDAPVAKPCTDKERGCDAARAALGSSPVGGDGATDVHNGSNEGGAR